MANPFARAAQAVQGRPLTPRASIFAGADTSRVNEDWMPWTFSPDYETKYYLRFLRARARQLVRDNSHAAGFVDSVADNVAGPNGIMLQARNVAADGKTLLTSVNDEIERGWAEWGGDPELASVDGLDSWVDLQRLFVRTMAMDGEAILRLVEGFPNRYGFALQFMDADLLDETYNVPAAAGQNEIRMGVEIDTWNRPVRYWFWDRYILDGSGRERSRIAIPAAQIIHGFLRYRVNQTRGVTWFAPAMSKLHHVDGYEFSELVAARTAAAKMGWIVNKTPEAVQGYEPPKPGEKPRRIDVQPGVVEELAPGQEFQQFDPTHPSTTFDAFQGAALRAAARGLNVSALTFTGDLRQANYSSMRAGLLPERDHWRALQVFTSTRCHRRVFRSWLRMADLAEAIALDARVASDYQRIQWHGRGWKWVDPYNDLRAAKLELDLGLNSRTNLGGEQGRDFEETVDQLASEQEYAEAAGVDVSGNQISGVNPTSVSPAGNAEDAAQDDASKSDAGDGSNDANSPTDNGGDSAAGHHGRRLRAVRGGGR